MSNAEGLINRTEWNIKAPSSVCHVCGRAFADRDPFVSRLSFGAEGYERRDCCIGCWHEAQRSGSLSIWKSLYRPPPPPPPEPIQRETAESLLRRFMEEANPSRRNVIFILAVMLERRRVLVERDVQVRQDGVKIRLYEHRKTGETFFIPDPGLRLADLQQVQQEILTLLGGSSTRDLKTAQPEASPYPSDDGARRPAEPIADSKTPAATTDQTSPVSSQGGNAQHV